MTHKMLDGIKWTKLIIQPTKTALSILCYIYQAKEQRIMTNYSPLFGVKSIYLLRSQYSLSIKIKHKAVPIYKKEQL